MENTPQQQPQFSTEYSARRAEEKRRISYEIKAGVLFIITLGAAFILGQYLSYSFYQNVFSLPQIAIPLVITFAVFITFFFLSVLLIQSRKLLTAMAVLSCISMVSSFFSLTQVPFVLGTVICLILFIYVVFEIKSEINTRIKIRFVHALNSVTTKVIFAVAVLLASVFYGMFMTRSLDENNFLMPRSVFRKSIPLVQGVAQSAIGNIDFNKSMRQIARDKVDELIIQQFGAAQAAQVPTSTRNELVQSATEELSSNFEGLLGIRPDENKPLIDAVYDGLLNKFNSTDPVRKSWILLGLAVLFVFSMQALSIFVRIALIPIAFVIYELLLRTKFAHIVYENVSKETVTI